MASTWQKMQEFYNWVLENGEVEINSSLPSMLLFAFYLLVMVLGPFYMYVQKLLKLRGLLVACDLATMTLSSYVFYEFLITSIFDDYSYLCQPVD